MAQSLWALGLMLLLSGCGRQALIPSPLPADTVRLTALDTKPRTSIVHENARVAVDLRLFSPRATTGQVEVSIQVRAANFKNPASVERTYRWSLGPGTTRRTLVLVLDHPDLQWPLDFHETHEFTAGVRVVQDGRLVDADAARFSFTTVHYDPMVRIWTVNGKRVYPQPKQLRADGGFPPNANVGPAPGR